MKWLVFKRVMVISLIAISHAAVSKAASFFGDPCDEKKVQMAKARSDFDQCIEKVKTEKPSGSNEELAQKCPSELTGYTKAVTELESCKEKVRLTDKKNNKN